MTKVGVKGLTRMVVIFDRIVYESTGYNL